MGSKLTYPPLIFVIGLMLSGASPTRQTAQAQHAEKAYSAEQSLRGASSALQGANNPDGSTKPCPQGREDRGSDLCAQWKAADAAWVSSFWSERTFWLELAGFAVGFLTLVAAGAAAWFAKRAADHTAEANLIAQTNSRQQLRPYMYPAKAWFKLDKTYEPTVFIEIRNFGQTPALDTESWIHTWVECFPSHDPLPRPPVGFMMGRSVVGPGGTSEFMHPRGHPLNEHSRTEIEAGRAALYVYGEVKYRDTFGQSHWSKYMYFASGEDSLARGRLSPYLNGNEIGSS